MKTVKCFYSFTVLVVLSFISKRVITETVKCPRYCTCYLNVTDYKRSVVCVSRRLDNIDLTVPKRVQTLDLSNNSISVLEDRGFQVKLFIFNNAMVTPRLGTYNVHPSQFFFSVICSTNVLRPYILYLRVNYAQ